MTPPETHEQRRARRLANILEVPGSRHRLKVIDCGHCGRVCFKFAQRCPGKPLYRPPVAEWFRGVLMCSQCVRVLFDGTRPKSRAGRRKNEPAGESRAQQLGRGV